MPNHQIFNERTESQDRALKVIEQLGYTVVPRGEAERKRGSRRAVLFEDELQTFLGKQHYAVGNELRHFSGGSVSKAIAALNQNSTARSRTIAATPTALAAGLLPILPASRTSSQFPATVPMKSQIYFGSPQE